eukprot:3324740-Rhodomonas_salina.1
MFAKRCFLCAVLWAMWYLLKVEAVDEFLRAWGYFALQRARNGLFDALACWGFRPQWAYDFSSDCFERAHSAGTLFYVNAAPVGLSAVLAQMITHLVVLLLDAAGALVKTAYAEFRHIVTNLGRIALVLRALAQLNVTEHELRAARALLAAARAELAALRAQVG